MRWLESITDSMDVNLSELQEPVEDRAARHAASPGDTESRLDSATEQRQPIHEILQCPSPHCNMQGRHFVIDGYHQHVYKNGRNRANICNNKPEENC